MPIDDIVKVTITKQGANISRAGFGNLALFAAHNFWPDRVRRFSSTILDELTAMLVPVTHPIYLMAAAARAQNPAVSEFYVCKRTRVTTQTIELAPVAAPTEGEVFSVTIDGVKYEFTATGTLTIAAVCTGLSALIDAATDLVAVGTSGTKVVVTPDTPGAVHTFTALSSNLTLLDATADAGSGGIAGDLADAKNITNAWYGVQLDSQSAAEIIAAAAWVESNRKLFIASNGDTACLDPSSTTDVAAALKTSNYARTAFIYHPNAQHYMGCRWAGKQFPKDPGSTNWAHQQVVADVYELTAGQIAALEAKNANFFVETNSVSTTFWGSLAGGEWIDITHFIDWMTARTQERYWSLLVSLEKLPYTQAGIDAAANELRAQLYEGGKVGGIDLGSPITVIAPNLADISPIDIGARVLKGITGKARLAGAVNKLEIEITLSLDA